MYLGFDTSNYTTSVAVYDGVEIKQAKKVLCVKSGEKGLRQSDAVFQHTVNMPSLLNSLEINDIGAVGVSTRPRNIQGSYMPCFLVGVNTANAVSKAAGVPMYETSHQVGHILASLYSVNRLDLINEQFIAFHLSGGTTEALLVKPDESEIISAGIIAQSLDLKAGQAVDRTGVMLGLDFPCGKQLDLLSRECEQNFKIKPSMKGLDCSLSGVENKARTMLENGASKQETAKFTLTYISQTICEMLRRIKREYGDLPVVFSGGVASNSLLRQYVNNEFNAYFAQSEFSLDNAAGCAVYAYLKENRL